MSAGAAEHDLGPAATSNVAPQAPAGARPSALEGVRRELSPQPGRAANTLRLMAIALIIVALCETFRIPNAATAAYMAFIIFKSDADATIPVAVVAVCAIVFGIMIAIVYFAVTLDEPALRIPLMAIIAFGAAFLSRASTMGVAAFVSGLFTVISLTKGDDLLSGDLSPDTDANTERVGLPSLASMPPEEALVHNLLWLALAVAVAVLVILAVDRLTGPDPERKLREAVSERLSALAAFCGGDPDARQRVVRYARAGTAALTAQNTVAGKLSGGRFRPAFGEAVIGTTFELMLLTLAFAKLPARPDAPTALRDAAPVLADAATAVRAGTKMTVAPRPPAAAIEAVPEEQAGAMAAAQLAQSLGALRRAVDDPSPDDRRGPAAGLLKPDAFTNLGYRRYALKVTLAVMACYLFMNLSDWSSISTCVTTAFVVSLDGIGQSIHKMMLRVAGALAGAAVGFGCILFVMPALTDLGQLLCVMAPVLAAGAWIRVGGARFSYFGQQMAFAFMLVVLQDYGPTLHFQTGRDRVIGILVGDIAVVVVFLHIWPVHVGTLVRDATAAALEHLAAPMTPGSRQAHAAAVRAFADTMTQASGLVADHRFEVVTTGPNGQEAWVDTDLLLRLQSLAVPALLLTAPDRPDTEPDDGSRDIALRALAAWLRKFALWTRGGAGGDAGVASLPQAPDASSGHQPWTVFYGLLLSELHGIVRRLSA